MRSAVAHGRHVSASALPDGYGRGCRDGCGALGRVPVVHVTLATVEEWPPVPMVTGETVVLANGDTGSIGDAPTTAAAKAVRVPLAMVTLAEAKRVVLVSSRRWLLERGWGEMARCRLCWLARASGPRPHHPVLTRTSHAQNSDDQSFVQRVERLQVKRSIVKRRSRSDSGSRFAVLRGRSGAGRSGRSRGVSPLSDTLRRR